MSRLTLADLVWFRAHYGGTLEGTTLVGALIDGRRVDLGPTAADAAVSL